MFRNVAFSVVLVISFSPIRAQTPDAVGAQFTINSYTTGDQLDPAVAPSGSGDFVVVWQSYGSDNGDTSGRSVQGQRFAADGSSAGSQFLVNTYKKFDQLAPAVGALGSGDFVVVWESDGAIQGDTGRSIQGQLFAADGSTVGFQFLVNSYTTGPQQHPAVAVNGSGDFVVVWESLGADNGDTSGRSIQGQRFAADGSTVGSQFAVNSYTTGDQEFPAVAVNGSGDFVVVWQSYGSGDGDTDNDSIQGQLFAADGSAVGSQFQVNSYTTGFQVFPEVAVGGSGEFVVVWASSGDHTDNSNLSVQGQLVAADGSLIGSQFLVNSYTPGIQWWPAVAVDESGDFVVVWEGVGPDYGAYSSISIQGQRFAADGSAVGAQFLVNSSTTDPQGAPAIASVGSGLFAVVWEGSGSNIEGRRFSLPIFSDGFESGDLSAWSASVQ